MFRNPNVKGVVLHIDSPGGAPVEAERISTAITTLKAKHKKEVVAIINNIGASAAYMIALNADLAKKWPSITKRKDPLPDHADWKDVTGKLDQLIK